MVEQEEELAGLGTARANEGLHDVAPRKESWGSIRAGCAYKRRTPASDADSRLTKDRHWDRAAVMLKQFSVCRRGRLTQNGQEQSLVARSDFSKRSFRTTPTRVA